METRRKRTKTVRGDISRDADPVVPEDSLKKEQGDALERVSSCAKRNVVGHFK